MARPIPSEQLSAYLDGELTDQEQAELEEHLASDPALREELEELESAVAFLRTHGPVQAPPDFKSKVLKAVEGEPMPGRWRRWLRRPFGIPFEGLAVALAAALVLLIALPVGWNTAQQAGDDLLGDPYGFVRSDEAQAPADAVRKSTRDGAPADAEPTEQAAPAPTPTKGVSTTTEPSGEIADGKTTAGDEAAPTEGVADAEPQAPAGTEAGGSWRYEILTYDADALASLREIAARHRGQVLDESGAQVTSGELPDAGGTYVVALPASSLPAFGDALRSLGSVTEQPADRVQRGETVQVRVDLQRVDAQKAPTYQPSTETQ